jgi:repressor LexA
MLTQRQKEALGFIQLYYRNFEIMPTFDEIRLGIGMASKSGVHRVVEALVERNHLRRIPNRARALELVKEPHLGVDLATATDHELAVECSKRGYAMLRIKHELARGAR